jgi:cytochrome c
VFSAALLSLGSGQIMAPAAAKYDPTDEWQGLPAGEGREEVYYGCIACHSTAIIQQQRLSRGVWDEVLDYMVERMGMPELADGDRRVILDYLVKHFGQDVPR